jgi:Helix-turn-helix domain
MSNNGTPSGFTFQCDPSTLRPLIAAVVTEVLSQTQIDREQFGARLCYSEPEAAELLGLREHQLRDERRRGRIAASMIVGRRIRYATADLLSYLAARRVEARP